jgi:N-acetylglucosaminyldiphosphoundecaprenol N-acetyl-beta-D-mannosaminyltransferase
VFGFVPSDGDLVEAVEAVLSPTVAPRLVVTPNLDHVVRLRRDPRFRRAYRRSAMVLCDGFPVHAYARLHAHRSHRVTGCDLAVALMQRRRPDAWARWFFVVDCEETAEAVRDWAKRQEVAERVEVAVPPVGFIGDAASCEALVGHIAAHRTTLLVMGVGAPQSEVFVDGVRELLPPCWAICVGQAVKVALGLVQRAPPPLRALQLEWFWRVCQEPRRLGRRYALGGFTFMLAVADDLLGVGRAVREGL